MLPRNGARVGCPIPCVRWQSIRRKNFEGVFEGVLTSDDWNWSCLGRRGLAALDLGEQASEGCLTTVEFHELWRAPSVSLQVPEVLGWGELMLKLRQKRVIILGELHASMGGRGTQISILADMAHALDGEIVLICEQPVLEYQEPVIAAAKQYQIEVRTLESEELAMTESPSVRDEVVRNALAEMVKAEPETTFVVCYGDNHRRSLHAAVTEAGVPCASIALVQADGMFGSAMRATQGRIQGRCFGYSDDLYWVTGGSYATLLGAPGLDRAFLAE